MRTKRPNCSAPKASASRSGADLKGYVWTTVATYDTVSFARTVKTGTGLYLVNVLFLGMIWEITRSKGKHGSSTLLFLLL